MQSLDKKTTFYFQAGASSLGGQLDAPTSKVIPHQASVSLPAVGGFATTRTEAFNFDQLVSCRAAYTLVSGRRVNEDQSFSILVTSVVEGLNILEVVTAERIVAQISIDHPTHGRGRRRISLAGSQYEGLRLAGHDVTPTLNRELLNSRRGKDPDQSRVTWEDFRQVGREQATNLIRWIEGQEDRNAYDWAVDRYQWMTGIPERQDGGSVLCSLVEGVPVSIPGKSLGHIVEISDFGRIFLGEILVSSASIQFSMIRAELGCNVQGQVTVGMAGGGGHTVPPSGSG